MLRGASSRGGSTARTDDVKSAHLKLSRFVKKWLQTRPFVETTASPSAMTTGRIIGVSTQTTTLCPSVVSRSPPQMESMGQAPMARPCEPEPAKIDARSSVAARQDDQQQAHPAVVKGVASSEIVQQASSLRAHARAPSCKHGMPADQWQREGERDRATAIRRWSGRERKDDGQVTGCGGNGAAR